MKYNLIGMMTALALALALGLVMGAAAELKGFVESGKMTQEQADLVLSCCQQRQSRKDGANCGYQFQNGSGKGDHGGFGGRGGRGGHGMMGGRGMYGQQSAEAQGYAEGTDLQAGAQTPEDSDGI